MSLQHVLVTGGAGYIGSHTCKALAQNGFKPVAYDNLSTGHADAVKWGPLVVGGIGDEKTLTNCLDFYRPVGVIHFAALAYVGESVIKPADYYHNNVAGTYTLLDACRRKNTHPIVFSSSCATYGIPKTVPISENTPQQPINPYGRTKLICEQMLGDFDTAYGMTFAALRYFNAAGADPESELGERHDPETHLIPRVLMAAFNEISHLDIFGDDYDTSDGTCIRDYIHVTDLADAHVNALKHLLNGTQSFHVNLGTGQGYSIGEIVNTAGQTLKREVPTKIGARRPGDPPTLVADPSRAGEILGFKPRFSDIETIIHTAAQFKLQHQNGQVEVCVNV